MDLIIFYNYLNYQSKSKKSILKILSKIPFSAVLQIAVICLTYIALGVLNFYNSAKNYMWIPYVLIIVEIVIFNIYFEQYQIKNSSKSKLKFKQYCDELYDWIKDNYIDIKSENIEELKNRIDSRIIYLESKMKKSQDKLDKWLQMLFIPFLISAFGGYINKQVDTNKILESVIAFFAVFAMLYIGAFLFINFFYYFKKKKISQMKDFKDDLQGIIDVKFSDFCFDTENQE